MSSIPIYNPHGRRMLSLLVLILSVVVIFLLVGVADVAFQKIGFSRLQFSLVLISTLIGSYVNIPLWKKRGRQRVLEFEEIKAFWVTYRIPHIALREFSTVVAMNLGGAIIPTLVSIYLLITHLDLIAYAAVGTIVISFVVHLLARKVRGVGIVTPAFIPPIAAALVAYFLLPGSPAVIAYVSGTLGSLIGADLSNLKGIGELGAPLVSIGGGGTFDGVFLTGIIAVLLV